MNYDTKVAAARLIQRIEGRIDPFDVAIGNDSSMRDEVQTMIESMGGKILYSEISPGAAALYLVALMIVNSD